MQSLRFITKARVPAIQRAYAKKAGSDTTAKPQPSATTAAAAKKTDSVDTSKVTGLTDYVYKHQAGPVGPGASTTGEFKVPEYFCYDRFSYHGAEVEMQKYRCPQPSAVKSN